MRLQVNLASRPFVELRPFFLRLRLIMGALALAGIGIAIAAHVLADKAARQQLALDRLRNETITLQQSKLHTEQRMRDPVNARILDRAHFLNALFLRKSFSWTAVMMDLENVLPNGLQVTSIEPAVSPTGTVVVRLRVAGERANAVQLVRNLERSRRFLQPRLAGEASQLKENNNGSAAQRNPALPAAPAGVEFDILADYNPLPPGEAYSVARPRSVAASQTAEGIPVIRPARVVGASSGANLRRGYPRDGVKLQPYGGPGSAQGTPQRLQSQGASR